MVETISINLRTTSEKAQLLTEFASHQDRSRNYLINQALDNYIQMQKGWMEGIEEAKAEIRNGQSVSIDEVFKRLED